MGKYTSELKKQISSLERKVLMYENSMSLRIGREITKSIRRPWRLPLLPFTLIRAAVQLPKPIDIRVEGSKKTSQGTPEIGILPTPVLSSENEAIFEQLKPHFCPSERHNFEYELLKILHEHFKEIYHNYWAIGGTLLGQIKYDGTIPWDHDIDVFCEKLTYEQESELIEIFSQVEGCEIRRWLFSDRIPGMQILDTRGKKGIAIDIFYGLFVEDTIYTIGINVSKFPEVGRQGVDRIISPGNRTVNFGNTQISVPTEEATLEYLTWKFGNWKEEYVIFDFKEKTSLQFQANEEIDEMLRSFVVNRSLE
ncbi:MAG: LicD family protein [Candidatus Poseidonia sp.]|nr:LicD family protein [Poseidonia sp.]